MDDKSNKKICPKCRLEVDKKATKCQHCQSDIRSWHNRHPILFFIIAVCILPTMIISMISDSNTPEPTPAEQIASMKKGDFASLAKMNVRGILKSPSTAKFNTSPTVTQDPKKPNSYMIESWVDSQNSFGATIRSYWSVKAHYIGADTSEEIEKGPNWIIDEFIFDGKKM